MVLTDDVPLHDGALSRSHPIPSQMAPYPSVAHVFKGAAFSWCFIFAACIMAIMIYQMHNLTLNDHKPLSVSPKVFVVRTPHKPNIEMCLCHHVHFLNIFWVLHSKLKENYYICGRCARFCCYICWRYHICGRGSLLHLWALVVTFVGVITFVYGSV